MKFTLITSEEFEKRFPNLSRSGAIPTYWEVVKIRKDGVVSTRDKRVKDHLEERYGFKLLSAEGYPSSSPPKNQDDWDGIDSWREISEPLSGIKPPLSEEEEEDWTEEGERRLGEEKNEQTGEQTPVIKARFYCRLCGEPFSDPILPVHLQEHDIEEEEYRRLPVMIPDCGMILYWNSPELRKAFPQPMNLLEGNGKYANYLDWLKLEGIRRSKEISKYFEVPFIPKDKKTIVVSRGEAARWEYCKVCGFRAEVEDELDKHVLSHGMDLQTYNSLPRRVPNICMDMWYKHADLKKAFPNPMDMKGRFGPFENFLDWNRKDGVKKWPHLREFFRGKKV